MSYENDAPKIFVRPNPFNEHVTFHDFLMKVRGIPADLGGANIFSVEDVAYQKAAIQEMERAMLPVVPMKPTTDKRSRLQVVAPLHQERHGIIPADRLRGTARTVIQSRRRVSR